MKIAIIGLGNVGSTIAYQLCNIDKVNELVLFDIDDNKAKAQKLDIEDGNASLNKEIKISYNNDQELNDTDIIIYCVSIGGIPNNRLEEYKITKKITEDVAKQINNTKFNGIIICVSNPVDIITNYLQKLLNYDYHKIIGSGTLLDTSRLKCYLSNKLDTKIKDITGYIIGEHGSTQVPVLSSFKINNRSLLTLINDEDKNSVHKEALERALFVKETKGFTNYGIASSVSLIVDIIINHKNNIISISTYDEKEDLYYGYPSIFKDNKFIRQEISLLDNEKELLNKSIASIIKVKDF
ncbi:MAG: NAD(P)-binding domain-containing protein [Bacilli bacterium]|jgi:L-lactate dehydrogenase|nr:NAD(P)-binding domain-containing protein [Bacilli bacterium]